MSATLVVRDAEAELRRNLSRMGADIIVIPWGTMSQDFDGAHLVGMMTDRWMPRAYMDRIAAVPGVEIVSPQLYLSTLADSPFCSLPEMYLVAYDPVTDFVLEPWLEHDPIGNLRLGEAVGGAAVFDPGDGQNIQVYGYPLKLVRTLEETGGDVDQVLFVSFDTAQAILEQVQSQPRPAFEIAPASISTAMVKVRLGSDPHEVAVRILEQVPSVVPIESTGFFQTQRGQMVGLLRIVLLLAGLTWVLATLFMGLVFSLAANERRREIAMLRALGATEPLVLRMLLLEGVALALSGGATGVGLIVLVAGLFQEQIAHAVNIQITLPPPLLLLTLVAAGLAFALVSVTVAAWIPASRLSRQEPALAMRE
ncbi:MAG: ABC transporter permease [Anaerolineae bacterium]|nr:ABC transporter permease [Anaerolineae bacterium]